MMWWFCVLFVAVSGRPNETRHSGYVNSDVAASAPSFSRNDRPGLAHPNPHYNPKSINGQECMQPGDLFNVVQGDVYYVCSCAPNEKGSLVLKCSPCNRCSRRNFLSHLPDFNPIIALPVAPEHSERVVVPVSSPVLSPLEKDYMPKASVPISVPYPLERPYPMPELLPRPTRDEHAISPPTKVPIVVIGSPKPVLYLPVPVPSPPASSLFIPVPSPFKSVPYPPVPVPSPFNPLPFPPIPVPSPFNTVSSFPVPSLPEIVPSSFNHVLSPSVPVPSPPEPVLSPPESILSRPEPVPSPPGNRHILDKGEPVIVPVSGSTEHCRHREPFVPFREPNVPCKLFVCKVKYNLVYVETLPDPLCSGMNEFVDSRSSDASAEATSNVKSWGLQDFLEWVRSHPSAQVAHIANDGLSSYEGLHDLGNSQSLAQADATAKTVLSGYKGFGGLVNSQSSAQTEALANTGLSGYGDLSGSGNKPSGQANTTANERLSGFVNLGGWGYRQGSALSNAVFKKYEDIIGSRNSDSTAQADTTANIGLSGYKVFVGRNTSRNSDGWGKSRGPVLAFYNYLTDNNGHDGELRRASQDDQDISEKENSNGYNRLGCGSSPLDPCSSDRSASALGTNRILEEGTNSQLEGHGQATAQPHTANVFLSRYGGLGMEIGLSSSQAALFAADIRRGGNFGTDLLINDKTP